MYILYMFEYIFDYISNIYLFFKYTFWYEILFGLSMRLIYSPNFQQRPLAPSSGIMASVCPLWEQMWVWKHVCIFAHVYHSLCSKRLIIATVLVLFPHIAAPRGLCVTQYSKETLHGSFALWRSVFFCTALSERREEVSAGCNLICVADVLI